MPERIDPEPEVPSRPPFEGRPPGDRNNNQNGSDTDVSSDRRFCFDSEGRVRPCAENERGLGFFESIQPGIINFINALGGAGSNSGGGGGATGTTGSEGQASGAGQPQNVQALRDLLTTLVSQAAQDGPPTFQLDPRFAEQFGLLNQEIANSAGKLAELDDEAKADFAAQEQARLAEVDEQAKTARDQLLTRLFGSGVQQSSIAASQAGQFAADVARVRQQVRGDIAGQRLQTRQFLSQQNIAGLQLRANLLAQEQSAALQELGINADAVNAERTRNARLLSDILGFETQERTAIRTAQIGANAQIRAAQIAADASKFAARLGAGTDLVGLQLQRELGLLSRDTALRQLDLERRGQDVDVQIARISAEAANRESRRRSRAQLLGSLGALALRFAFFSDERLKQDITPVGMIGKLKLVSFRYIGKQSRHLGFIAQDVLKHVSGAVHSICGFYAVDYGHVINSELCNA